MLAALMRPDCSKSNLVTLPDQSSSVFSSSRIFRSPNPFPCATVAACNAACLEEPFCLAWALKAAGKSDAACELFSAVWSNGTTVQAGTLFGSVQRCPLCESLVSFPFYFPRMPSSSLAFRFYSL